MGVPVWGSGQVTLLAPAAYVSVAVMYCQIIVTFLSVTHGDTADLHGTRSPAGSQLLLAGSRFYTSPCKHPAARDKTADNWSFGIGSRWLSWCEAPVFEAAFFHIQLHDVNVSHGEAEGDPISKERSQTIVSRPAAEGGFLKRCLHRLVINHAHECQNGHMMGRLCGCSLWELEETFCPACVSASRRWKQSGAALAAYQGAHVEERLINLISFAHCCLSAQVDEIHISPVVGLLRIMSSYNLLSHWLNVWYCGEGRDALISVHLYYLIVHPTH